MSLLHKTIRAGFWAAGSSYFFFGFNFVGQLILARFILPTDFGVYAFAVAIKDVISIFLGFSFTMAFINSNADQGDFDAMIWLSLFLGMAYMLIAGFGFLVLSRIESRNIGVLFALSCSTQVFGFVGQAYLCPLERDLNYRKASLLSGAASVVTMAVTLMLAMVGLGVWSLLVRDMTGMFLLFTAAVWSSTFSFKGSFDLHRMRNQLKFATRMLISRLFEQVFIKTQNLLIGPLMGKPFLGHFYQAQYLGLLPNSVLAPFSQKVLFTAYSHIKENREQVSQGLMWSSYLLLRLLLPLSYGCFIAGSPIIRLLLGGQWGLAAELFPHFSLTILVLPLFVSLTTVCYSFGHANRVAWAYAIATLISMTGIFLAWNLQRAALIPWGIGLGLAMGTVYVLLLLSRNGIGLSIRTNFVVPCAIYVASIVLHSLAKSVFLSITVFGILFLLMLIKERREIFAMSAMFAKAIRSKETKFGRPQ